MTDSEYIQTLNELLQILCRSLPAYLADAHPWSESESHPLRVALDRIVADQQHYVRRLVEEITARNGQPDFGRFDMSFASKNDLAADYLRLELIKYLQQDMAAIERCVARLENCSSLHALAEEILGNVRGHLDILSNIGSTQ